MAPTLGVGSPGDLLNSRYRLVRRIAGGGMGDVWEGRDELLDRPVAVKILLPSLVQDENFQRRFREEARHTARLVHPGIAAVYDFGEDASRDPRALYLVMELVDGVPLSDLLHAGRMDPLRAMHLVGQAGLALQAAHDAGVIHRDVKPGNILVRPDDTVKITDFGIARAADSVTTTQSGMVLGTASYISPEQASGGRVTAASDVYSLGVVAYECLAGHKPFTGATPVAIATAQVQQAPPPLPRRVPAPIAQLVMAALAKDPAQRPPSSGAFGRRALELAASLSQVPAAAASTTIVLPGDVEGSGSSTVWSASPRARRLATPRRRRRRLAALTVLAAALVVILAFAAIHAIADPGPNAAAGGTARALVQVRRSAVVGLPWSRAAELLRSLGVRPVRRDTASDRPADTVIAVDPSGSVPVGTRVVVDVATTSSHGNVSPGTSSHGTSSHGTSSHDNSAHDNSSHDSSSHDNSTHDNSKDGDD